MPDREIICDTCHTPFVWTAREQAFFTQRGLPDPPKRCIACRRTRKVEQRQRAPEPPAGPLCSWCGDPARVPFTVAAHRPVACEACYRWRLGIGSGLRESGR